MQDGPEDAERGSAPACRVARDQLSHSTLRRLVDFWLGLAAGGALPPRRAVRPEDLHFILAQVMLVDVLRRAADGGAAEGDDADDSGLRFRFRLVGTRIEETGHPGLQGRWAHELQPAPYRRLVLDAYRQAVREAAPNCYRIALDHGGQCLRYERVVLPFGDDGLTVDTLLIGTEWGSENDAFFRTYPGLPQGGTGPEAGGAGTAPPG